MGPWQSREWITTQTAICDSKSREDTIIQCSTTRQCYQGRNESEDGSTIFKHAEEEKGSTASLSGRLSQCR